MGGLSSAGIGSDVTPFNLQIETPDLTLRFLDADAIAKTPNRLSPFASENMMRDKHWTSDALEADETSSNDSNSRLIMRTLILMI